VKACDTYLQNEIDGTIKCHLLIGQTEQDAEEKWSLSPRKFWHYLNVPVPAHRKAFTRLILSNHFLRVEQLQHDKHYRPCIPRQF
jgi:hypothetical protein